MLILDFTNVIISMLFSHDSKYLYTKDMKMGAESIVLYKLIVLYMLDRVNFTLTNSQISDFILEKGYTNYFTVQRAFHELEEENMLRVKQIRNMSHYALSDEGSEAIEMFEYQIPNSIKEDIAQFLKEKEYELRKEASVTADFYPSKGDEYTVNLKIREKESPLLEINLNVVSRDQAVYICDHWEKKHSDVYSMLIEKLLFDEPNK